MNDSLRYTFLHRVEAQVTHTSWPSASPGYHLPSPSPSLWSCSVPLNLAINSPVSDTVGWKGREAGAIYKMAVFTLRTRPFIPGHLPEARIPLALYMGLFMGLCATSLPLRGSRNPDKPGGKASSTTLVGGGNESCSKTLGQPLLFAK